MADLLYRQSTATSQMHILLCFSLLLTSFLRLTDGLYFHIKETETRCFLEDIPEDTMVTGTYKLLTAKGKSFEAQNTLSFYLVVTDPHDKAIISRVYSSEGRFVYTAHVPGEYRMCISSNSDAWFGGKYMRVHLDIAVGEHANNYKEIAARDRLNELQLRVRQLSDQVQIIAKDQNYQRVREEYFRQLSESTSQRVTYWSIFQLILLVGVGFWQMRHLRAFFQAKKLV